MATPVTLSWSNLLNIQYSSIVDQRIQHKESLWQVKEVLKAAGHSVIASAVGNSGTAGTGDNWTTAASLDYTGSQVAVSTNSGSPVATTAPWCHGRTPLGWLPNSAQLDWIIFPDEAGATPGQWAFRLSSAPYTGGDNTEAPDNGGTNEVELAGTGDDIISWTSPTNARMGYWYTSRGDIIFATKTVGDPFSSAIILRSNTGSGLNDGSGNYRFGLWGRTGTTTVDVLTTGNLSATGNWSGYATNGTTIVSPVFEMCGSSLSASWTGGTDSNGNTLKGPVIHGLNSASDGRIIGLGTDFYTAPTLYPAFGVDDTETGQDPRYIKIGTNLWLPCDPGYVGNID